ncbi:MAG TPA: beta-ketoacyl synthase chain length factor [Steroidobacteraceae bacterium]|nr:beta-ketoacyl synthase chain length factor [Steroidobacteraceae bacterium]
MSAPLPMSAFVQAVGLFAPGLPNWSTSLATLNGEQLYAASDAGIAPPQPQLLPPNERRRAPLSVLLALHAAEDAVQRSGIAAGDLPSVFGSSDAEMAIIHRISSALAEPARSVSPTDFHNSVHNAAAGYWGIAARATRSATTLAAFDGTCVAALQESFALLADGERAVLLVLYDVPPPVPLYEKRPIEVPVAVALVLSRESSTASLASVRLDRADTETQLPDPTLERLRRANPAARVLPLLCAIARGSEELVGLRAQSGRIVGVRVSRP